MADLEETEIYILAEKSLILLMFLDNIFGIWLGDQESLEQVVLELNRIHLTHQVPSRNLGDCSEFSRHNNSLGK